MKNKPFSLGPRTEESSQNKRTNYRQIDVENKLGEVARYQVHGRASAVAIRDAAQALNARNNLDNLLQALQIGLTFFGKLTLIPRSALLDIAHSRKTFQASEAIASIELKLKGYTGWFGPSPYQPTDIDLKRFREACNIPCIDEGNSSSNGNTLSISGIQDNIPRRHSTSNDAAQRATHEDWVESAESGNCEAPDEEAAPPARVEDLSEASTPAILVSSFHADESLQSPEGRFPWAGEDILGPQKRGSASNDSQRPIHDFEQRVRISPVYDCPMVSTSPQGPPFRACTKPSKVTIFRPSTEPDADEQFPTRNAIQHAAPSSSSSKTVKAEAQVTKKRMGPPTKEALEAHNANLMAELAAIHARLGIGDSKNDDAPSESSRSLDDSAPHLPEVSEVTDRMPAADSAMAAQSTPPPVSLSTTASAAPTSPVPTLPAIQPTASPSVQAAFDPSLLRVLDNLSLLSEALDCSRSEFEDVTGISREMTLLMRGGHYSEDTKTAIRRLERGLRLFKYEFEDEPFDPTPFSLAGFKDRMSAVAKAPFMAPAVPVGAPSTPPAAPGAEDETAATSAESAATSDSKSESYSIHAAIAATTRSLQLRAVCSSVVRITIVCNLTGIPESRITEALDRVRPLTLKEEHRIATVFGLDADWFESPIRHPRLSREEFDRRYEEARERIRQREQ